MTRRERSRLRTECFLDIQAFAERARRAVLEEDWQFLIRAGEALKPGPEYLPFDRRVLYAWTELRQKHGAENVTGKMVQQAVDPKVPLSNYSRAFRKIGVPSLSKRSKK